jgi:hypothetical protein
MAIGAQADTAISHLGDAMARNYICLRRDVNVWPAAIRPRAGSAELPGQFRLASRGLRFSEVLFGTGSEMAS